MVLLRPSLSSLSGICRGCNLRHLHSAMKSWRRRESEKGKARRCFLQNGSMFLEQLIADCNGMSNPIRMFSSDQISKATNHLDPNCVFPVVSFSFIFYKGVIEGRSYAIKRFIEIWDEEEEERAYNDIVLSARLSKHIGFLKLIGWCLEFPLPVLVFEDLEYRFLNLQGSLGFKVVPVVLPWNVRLKIAKEVAIAITYLHTAFPRIIIHRNIKPWNVFLDKNGTAKLTDFSRAVTLPQGKSWIEVNATVTDAYTDSTYLSTGILTEYADVCSFGIFMLVLLMGRLPVMLETDHYHIYNYMKYLRERGEPIEFGGDSNDMRPGQMTMFLDLALRCCEKRNEDRPKMISVAKEIKLIERSLDC